MEALGLQFLEWFYDWVTPWYYLSIALIFFIFSLVGTRPFVVNQLDKYSLGELVIIRIRQGAGYAAIVIFLILPAFVFYIGWALTQDTTDLYLEKFTRFMWNEYLDVWTYPIIGWLLGLTISMFHARVIVPHWSSLKRRYSVKQSGDELSDIRAIKGRTKTRQYDPTKHYKKGHFFYGLDLDGKPIYDTDADWRARHQRYVGPTQVGKGVEFGVQLDQAIRKGYSVIFVDPKPDKHARAIMAQACEATGRRLVELDMRDSGKGKYAPFAGGDPRDRRARLLHVIGLADTGGDADYYKANEREIIDAVFASWDGTVGHLRKLLNDPKVRESVSRSRSYINEIMAISTFQTKPARPGLSVERSLLEDAVVYVRGDLDDTVVNSITTSLLMEIVQELKRLHSQRKTHCFVAVDEIAFLISEKIADALATIAGFDANMALAYQSEGDLLNLSDKTQNARAISQRVKVNCKTSLYYMAKDADTAEVMAEESGTIQKSVTFSQSVDVGRHLEESWENKRSVHKAEENLITANEAMMLPAQVGILYRPNELATQVFTSWVEVDIDQYQPKPKKATAGGAGDVKGDETPPETASENDTPSDAPTDDGEAPVDLGAGLDVATLKRRKHAPSAPRTKSIDIDDFGPPKAD